MYKLFIRKKILWDVKNEGVVRQVWENDIAIR